MDPTPNIVEDAKEATERALLEVYQRTSDTLELFKLRISFWDKLVILDAGALTLSLTAAGYFRGHQVGDGGVGYLLVAWKLLLFAIALAILAQWLATASATFLNRHLTSLSTHLKLAKVDQELKEAGFSLDQATATYLKLVKEEVDKTGPRWNQFQTAAYVAGAVAQICTIASFVWLYRYASTNLRH